MKFIYFNGSYWNLEHISVIRFKQDRFEMFGNNGIDFQMSGSDYTKREIPFAEFLISEQVIFDLEA